MAKRGTGKAVSKKKKPENPEGSIETFHRVTLLKPYELNADTALGSDEDGDEDENKGDASDEGKIIFIETLLMQIHYVDMFSNLLHVAQPSFTTVDTNVQKPENERTMRNKMQERGPGGPDTI